jgi:exopolysaccharide production protein ExoQ
VTTVAAPAMRRSRSESRTGLLDAAAFAASVLLLLIYSQGWEMPLTGGGDETSDSALIRNLFLPAYAIAVVLFAMTPWNVVRGLIRQPFLVLILFIAGLSLIWSVSPDQTSRRVFALVFTTLGGVVLAARFSWARLAEVLAATFAILAVLSLFAGLFLPSIGRMTDIFPGSWRGLWPEKNAFGSNMAQGVVICAAAALLNPTRAGRWWGATVLCLLMLLMSTSKTSLVAMMLGAGAIGLVWMVRRGPVAGVAATWTALVGITLVAAFAFFASDVLFGLLGKDATLTGRTKIWGGVMRQINERPWTGFGYAAIWDETDKWGPLAWITKDAGFRAHHAHNSWLEQWLSVGVPGLAAWAAFFLQTLVANIVALYREKGAYLALSFFVVYALSTLTESIAVVYNDMRWVIFVALAVKLVLPDAKPAPAQATAPGVVPIRRAVPGM